MDGVIEGYIKAVSLVEKYTSESEDVPFTPTFHFSIERYENTNEPFIRMSELENIISNLFGVNIEGNGEKYAPNENEIQALDCTTTKKVLRWSPKKGFETGIQELGEWYKISNDSKGLGELISRSCGEIIHNLKK